MLTFTGTFTEYDFFVTSGNLVAIDSHTEQHTGVPIHVNGLLIQAGRSYNDADGNVTMTGKDQVLEGDAAKFCSTLASRSLLTTVPGG